MRLPSVPRVLALALTLLASGGCGAPGAAVPPRPPFTPPPLAAEYLVRETRLAGGAVSVRMDIPLAPAGPKPAVIALVGDTRQVVGAGFVAVTYSVNWPALKGPTPPPAANPVGTWVLASPSADVLGERYLREIAATATEIVPQVIDWLETMPDVVDAARLGMVGASTNGFVTLQAVAADRRIGTAVAVAACGDYQRFLRDSSMGMQGRLLELAPAYAAWLREQEVAHHPRRLTHAALLMVNRVEDLLIPIACADATAAALRPAFAAAGAADRFRFLRLAVEGHGMDKPETDAAIEWLVRWLSPPR